MNAPVKTPPLTFAEAFLKMQATIKPAIKDTANGAFKGTKYADLGAVWDAVKMPLHEAGFSVIQSPDFEGDNIYLKTTILHVSGEKMEGRYPLKPSKQDPQGYGSALTYARRYSISAMLGVIADDDDDGNAASGRPAQVAPAPAPAKAQHDPDPDGQVTNWVNLQKGKITACERLPELMMWQDENEAALDRLLRKSKAFHLDLMQHFHAKQAELSKKETK